MRGLLGVALVLLTTSCVLSSVGDNSIGFHECLKKCLDIYNTPKSVRFFQERQKLGEKLLLWSIADECKYNCMWRAVKAYKEYNAPIPQFYGKWPFKRLFGIQEPASTLFSILNGLSNVVGVVRLRRSLPPSAPFFWLWNSLALVRGSLHTRYVIHPHGTLRQLFTDKFIVTTVGLYNVCIFFCEYICGCCSNRWPSTLGSGRLSSTAGTLTLPRYLQGKHRNWLIVIGAVMLTVFIHHVYVMTAVKFDYGYNMAMNVTIGILNTAAWVVWCIKRRYDQPYVVKALVVITCTNLLLLLELFDFPPLYWVLDAHALWHAGTAPLPLIWFSFAVDDCKHLMAIQKLEIPENSIESAPIARKLRVTHDEMGQQQLVQRATKPTIHAC